MMAERRVVVLRDVDKLKKGARAARPLSRAACTRYGPDPDRAERREAGQGAERTRDGGGFAPLTGDRLPRWVALSCARPSLGRTITPDAVDAADRSGRRPTWRNSPWSSRSWRATRTETIDERAVADVVGVRRGESVGDLLDAVAAKDAATALGLIPRAPAAEDERRVDRDEPHDANARSGIWCSCAARWTPPRALFNEFMALLKDTGAFPGRPWGEAVTAGRNMPPLECRRAGRCTQRCSPPMRPSRKPGSPPTSNCSPRSCSRCAARRPAARPDRCVLPLSSMPVVSSAPRVRVRSPSPARRPGRRTARAVAGTRRHCPATDSLFRRARRLVSEGNGVAGRALVDSLLRAATEGRRRMATRSSGAARWQRRRPMPSGTIVA